MELVSIAGLAGVPGLGLIQTMNTILNGFQTPWKVRNKLECWIIYPWMRILMAVNGIPWRQGWSFYGVPIIQKHHKSKISFGAGLSLRSSLRSNPLGVNHPVFVSTLRIGAVLEVGNNFAMTGGAICAADSIRIADNVVIGANSTIIDTDFHPIDSALRRLHPQDGRTVPVVIEDNVFIGMNCLILKGVTLGAGSVISAGSIVTKAMPPRIIAAGNPAKVLRAL
ncbi:Hexapeptide repeat of succinyl-transferase [Syntrophus gentianae]|uniref:Hexapeptide repeat of succinyl-transferase n=1 Tax=Syntrophus gentianae TaxID=43775 RepID=A0A1H7YBD1_9BACT|nr:acyltransferase [Syntrophus gentianae]SEM42638.1 Hexapeptide repeat of succinyl-transferase [Syntrophus gentianae]